MSTPDPLAACPGCGLQAADADVPPYEGYYNTSAGCWAVYSEVLGREFGNAILYGQVHQLSVDAYAVQHAGGAHPDKSIFIHLAGLLLMLEDGRQPTSLPRVFQHLAATMPSFPHFDPPASRGEVTVAQVAAAGDGPLAHAEASRAWARSVWAAWSPHHAAIRKAVEAALP